MPSRILILALAAIILTLGIFAFLPGTTTQPEPLDPSPVAITSDSPQATPTPTPTPNPTPVSDLTLIFGGDVMFGRTVETRMDTYGGTWPLSKLAATMSQADLTVVNLESPFRTDAPSTNINSLVLRGDPKGIESLTEAGVDLVSLSNNHITDMGIKGLQETQTLLDTHKIAYTGAGETDSEATIPAIIEKNNQKIGFLSYTYGVNFDSPGVHYNTADPVQVTKEVAELKPKVDTVIILVHFGSEYQSTPNSTQKTFAHAAIDAGASVVVGAHPHIPQPIEQYKDGLILYSLGNLVFDQEQSGNRNFSALASITLQGNKLKSLQLLPYQILNYGQPNLLEKTTDKERIGKLFDVPTGNLTF